MFIITIDPVNIYMPFMGHGAIESIVVKTVFIYVVVLHISFMCRFDIYILFHCVVTFHMPLDMYTSGTM